MYEPRTGPPIVHIPTSPGCNNRCEFCMDEARGMGFFTVEQHIEQLRAGRELSDAVTFTNGEPTLNSHLPELAEAARDLGYRIIGVITNGRRLARRDFVLALLDGGVNELTISAHGPTADVNDAITGRKGSWAQTRRGLGHLAELRPAHPFAFRINCTVVVKNLAHMRATYDYAMGYGPDIVNFNVVEARGAALRDFAGTVPRYVDVARAARESGLDFGSPTVSLSRIPPCSGGLTWAQDEFLLLPEGELTRYVPEEGKTKGPPCQDCAMASACPGVWQGYIDGHGWDEFTPLSAPHDRVLRVTTGARCLNTCGHCPSKDGAPLHDQLSAGFIAGHRRVLLAGGDPLLDPGLPEHLRLCRAMGFRHVAVETNGRVLSKADFAHAVVKLGLDEVVVRVHGADPSGADAVTGVRGSFRQAVAGIAAMMRRGQAVRIDVQAPGVDGAAAEAMAAAVHQQAAARATS